MKRVAATLVALVLGAVSLANAQEKMGLFGNPAFVLQPGIIKGFGDVAKRGPGASTAHFNARMVMALPTSIPRTTIVAIVQWTPKNDPTGSGAQNNAPAFVYGPVIEVFDTPQLHFDVDALFAYGGTGSNPPRSAYTHKFLVEGDFFVKLGSLMGMKAGQFKSLNAYAMFAYVLTGIDDPTPPAAPIESKDRMVLLAGLSLPIAPWHLK